MRRRMPALIVAIAALMLPAAVSAQYTIDFDAIANANFACHGSNYADCAFRVTGGSLCSWGASEGNYAGSQGMFQNQINGTTTVFRADFGAFTLTSIDLAQVFSGATTPTNVTFVGTFIGSGTTTQTFVIPGTGGPAAFSTYNFNPAFTNLASVSWTQVSPFHQFDNIALDGGSPSGTVTPEPITMTLMGTGLAGVAAARRRRKAAQNA
jgi:hypothetical protein